MNVSSDPVKKQLIQRARACIGVSSYRRNATHEEAPRVFNCFRFMQWLWDAAGVLLPDHLLIWPDAIRVDLIDIDMADLVFVPRSNYHIHKDDFGHVGLATGENTIIHATKWKNGVVEEPMQEFLARGCLGVRRVP